MTEIHTLALGFANALLVREQGSLLVDTGIHVDEARYAKEFARLGLQAGDIRLIVVTHGHADHYGQAALLKKMTGAPLLCHEKAAPLLRTGGHAPAVARNELGERVLKMLRPNLPLVAAPVEPDLVMAGEEFDLHAYGIDGKAIYTPGHTDCSISVVLASGQALVGDILVPSPFTGEPCLAYLATDEQRLLASVRHLLSQASLFYGGHGGPFTKDQVVRLL